MMEINVLKEFVEKKEVKKTRLRLKQADKVREYLQFVNFEPNYSPLKIFSFSGCNTILALFGRHRWL